MVTDPVFPLVIEPPKPDTEPVAWAEQARDELRASIERYAALLFRGWQVPSVEGFEAFVRGGFGDPLPYELRSSPRHAVANHIYTSTDHPPDQPIFLHNEQSYGHTWPRYIAFHCVTPPATQGATPIADLRRITSRIDPDIIEQFVDGYQLVRHFHDGVGVSWQSAFGCDHPDEIDEVCRRGDIDYEWLPDGLLRTRQTRPATAIHPVTGDELWFNHLTFFHHTTLPPDVLEAVLAAFPADQLPYDTRHHDGSAIDPNVVARLRAAYEAESTRFPWQQGDVLVLDNMLAAHAREPYTGDRKIVVAMVEPVHRT